MALYIQKYMELHHIYQYQLRKYMFLIEYMRNRIVPPSTISSESLQHNWSQTEIFIWDDFYHTEALWSYDQPAQKWR
jgi:hypothetical protein